MIGSSSTLTDSLPKEHNKDRSQNKRENNAQPGFRESVTKFFNNLLWALGGFYVIVLLLHWLNSIGLISPGSYIYGFDYFSSYMLIYLAIPVFLIGIIARQKNAAVILLSLFVIFWLFYGDHSLFNVHARTRAANGNGKISVMTINVDFFHSGLNRAGEVLENIRPDIICFQENDLTGEEGYQKISQAFPSYELRLGEKCELGILSLYPIEEFNEVNLPSRQPVYDNNTPEKIADRPHRHFLHAVISVKGRKVHVLNLRLIAGRTKDFFEDPLTVVRWGRYLLAQQNREAKVMADYISKLNGPIIFAGDLNAPPNASVIDKFNQLGVDVYRQTNKFPAPTFPAKQPAQRLDYIFCNSGFKPLSAKVLHLRLSDHLPVLAELSFKEDSHQRTDDR